MELQENENYENIYCIVDMHAITVPQVPKDLRRHTLSCSGIDGIRTGPKKTTLFIQSHVPAHAELTWYSIPQPIWDN